MIKFLDKDYDSFPVFERDFLAFIKNVKSIKLKTPIVTIDVGRLTFENEDIGVKTGTTLSVFWNNNKNYKQKRIDLILDLARSSIHNKDKVLRGNLTTDSKNFLDNKEMYDTLKKELTFTK